MKPKKNTNTTQTGEILSRASSHKEMESGSLQNTVSLTTGAYLYWALEVQGLQYVRFLD
jgi:hypothetical protein